MTGDQKVTCVASAREDSEQGKKAIKNLSVSVYPFPVFPFNLPTRQRQQIG